MHSSVDIGTKEWGWNLPPAIDGAELPIAIAESRPTRNESTHLDCEVVNRAGILLRSSSYISRIRGLDTVYNLFHVGTQVKSVDVEYDKILTGAAQLQLGRVEGSSCHQERCISGDNRLPMTTCLEI